MKDVTDKNFGVIIAFLLPGFILLWGLSFTSDLVATWLAAAAAPDTPSVGGFLYATLASLALGVLISAVRWAIVEPPIRWSGAKPRNLNFKSLSDKDKYAAFQGVIDNHYRYYQYYANSLVALIAACAVYAVGRPGLPPLPFWLLAAAIALILFLGSRDSLKKYFDRGADILDTTD